MLEMWKIIDPFSKAAWYGTDEHQQYCESIFRHKLQEMDSAVPILVSVDGVEMTLMKICLMVPDEPNNVAVYYVDPETLKLVRQEVVLFLKAHANKARVDVTARELQKLPEEMKRPSTPILKLPRMQTDPAAKIPGRIREDSRKRKAG